MQHNDIKIGEYYKYKHSPNSKDLIFVVGRDPFSSRYVATSNAWGHTAVLLSDADYNLMEPI